MAKKRQKKKAKKKAIALKGKGLDITVGGGSKALKGKGLDITVGGTGPKTLKGRGWNLVVGDEITQELKRIDKMPPGPARGQAFDNALKMFEDEVVRSNVTVKGVAAIKRIRRQRKRDAHREEVVSSIESFDEAIKEKGLDKDLGPGVKLAVERLQRGERLRSADELAALEQTALDFSLEGGGERREGDLVEKDPAAGVNRQSEPDMVQSAVDRAKAIIQLKIDHGIPVTQEERTFGDPVKEETLSGLDFPFAEGSKVIADPGPGQSLAEGSFVQEPSEIPDEAAKPDTSIAHALIQTIRGQPFEKSTRLDRILTRAAKEAAEQFRSMEDRGSQSLLSGIAPNMPEETFKRIAAPLVGTGALALGIGEGILDRLTGEKDIFEKTAEVAKIQEGKVERGTFLGNVGGELFDVVEGAAHILQAMLGDPLSKGAPDLDALAAKNRQMGSDIIGFGFGEIGAFFDDPVRAFRSSPILTTLGVRPFTSLAKQLVASKALESIHLSPKQIAHFTRLAELHDRVIAPRFKTIKDMMGRRADTKALFDLIVTKAAQKGDQLQNISNRLHQLTEQAEGGSGIRIKHPELTELNRKLSIESDPTKRAAIEARLEALKGEKTPWEIAVDDMEEALPRDEHIAASIGQLKDSIYGKDRIPGRPAAFDEQLAHQQPLHLDPMGPTRPPVEDVTGTQQQLATTISPLSQRPVAPLGGSAESAAATLQKPGGSPPLERISGKPGDPKQGALSLDVAAKMPEPIRATGLFGDTPGVTPQKPMIDIPGERPPLVAPIKPGVEMNKGPAGPAPVQEGMTGPGFSVTDILEYKTGVDRLPLPQTKWGILQSSEEVIAALRHPLKFAEGLKRLQDMIGAAQRSQAHKTWQLSKPLLMKIASEATFPFLTRKLSPESKLYLGEIEDVIVPIAFDAHVKYRAWSQDQKSWDYFHRLNQYMKRNLTTQNIKSGIGNYMSNLMMQMVHQGRNPFTIAQEGIMLNSQYQKWVHGEKLAAGEASFFKGMDDRGLAQSTALIEAELGSSVLLFGGDPAMAAASGSLVGATVAGQAGAAVGAVAGPLMQQIAARWPLKNILKAQQDFYQFGDNGFKWQQAHRHYQRNTVDFDSLKPGQYKVLPTNKGKIKIERLEGDHWSIDGKKSTKHDVKEILLDAAAESAFDRMFDYRDTPLLVDWLKTVPALGIVSPFITWQLKALDIPFFKKGLISRTFELPGLGLTNSPILAAKQFVRTFALSQRRSFIINGLRHQWSENRADFRRFLAFSPNQPRAILLRQTTSPLWIEADDIEQYNWQGPGQSLVRLADAWLNSAPSDEDLEEYIQWVSSMDDLRKKGLVPEGMMQLTDDYMEALLRKARAPVTVGDGLKIIGLGGSVWAELHEMFSDETERGRALNGPRLYTAVSTALLGGGFSQMLKIIMGLTGEIESDPYLISGFTERDSQAPEIRESLWRYSIRQVLGMGHRPQFVGNLDELDDEDLAPREYFKAGMRKQANMLKLTMLHKLRLRLKIVKRKGLEDRADDIQDLIDIGMELIDDEIERWGERVEQTVMDYNEVIGL